jgi:hypothetical protein
VNLGIAEVAAEGIWPHNLHYFSVKADIVHPTKGNSYGAERKARVAAINTGDNCLAENRKKAAAASSDTIQFERDGEKHTAKMVTVAQDGSALKRDYGHNYTGSVVAQCTVEKNTNLVVDLKISNCLAGCCNRKLNQIDIASSRFTD